METTSSSEHELCIATLIDAPRERIFKVWTTPSLLAQCWGPHGMTTAVCEMDLRPGGIFRTVLRTADGTEYPSQGIFLEIVAPERIVMTDAYEAGWIPSKKPFLTTIITLEEQDGKTKYTARARHWTAADREAHEKMGFHQGWGQSLERLVTLVTSSNPAW